MKKKKILKIISILLLLVLVIFLVYNLIFYNISGKTKINISMNDVFSRENDITATLNIYPRYSDSNTIKAKVKVCLYDSNDKKVDGVKEENYECDSLESLQVAYKVPNNIKSGIYKMRFKVKTKWGYDVVEKDIAIKDVLNHNLIISLDKGIYKPGDEVKFRGMLLLKKDNIPEEKELKVSIFDGNENKVYCETKKTSDYGILSGTFNLASEVNSGTYKIVFKLDNEEFSKSFTVNPYVAPKFGVEISTDKEIVKVDEETTVTVDSKYFFGEPVKNATVEINFSDKDKEKLLGITDENGKFEFKYNTNVEGNHLIKVKVVDESNYMVEEDYTVSCSNDVFKFEILPEYKEVISGVSNNIYVFTKKTDGTPLKTYNTITIGKITRQVITDENGIGVFSLSSSDIYSMKNKKVDIFINSESVSGEVLQKKEYLDVVSNKDLLIKTDKIKYNQSDDITISFEGNYTSGYKEVYVVKDTRVLNVITTDQEEVTFNIGDEFGLINIFTLSNDGKSFKSKRTVFVKPTKSLTVDIDTNEEVYKPGENLKLNLELKDENGNKVDGAILVSILDEAIQNLAINDLNVDNLMLSLKDIQLSDGIDLASVYATILDSKDDTVLMGLLLKQEVSIPEKVNNTYDTMNEKKEYGYNCKLAVKLLVVYSIVYVCIKYRKHAKCIVIEGLTLIAWEINILLFIITSYMFVRKFSLSFAYELINKGAVLALILYILFLHKNKKIFWMNSLYFEIIPMLLTFVSYIVYDDYGYEGNDISKFACIILSVVALAVIAIILVKNRKNILKNDKYVELKISSSLVMWAIYVLPVYFLDADEDRINMALAIECLLANIFLVLDLIKQKSINQEQKDEEKFFKINKKAVIALVILVVIGGLHIMRTWSMGMANSGDETKQFKSSSYTEMYSNKRGGFNQTYTVSDSAGAAGTTSITSGLFDIYSAMSSSSSNKKDTNSEFTKNTLSIDWNEKYTSEDENIRNVFLESLCFIPELVTKRGKASTEIKLSDNITTWQIQAVANTKDGRIGYGTDSFKVFKDFFVDFSLPTNSVVGDKISIPVTVYNYTDRELTVELTVKEDAWFMLGEFEKNVFVNSKEIAMVYVPIEILTAGENKFRINAKTESGSDIDIIEKTMETKPNGVEVSKVISSGTFEGNLDLDIIFNEKYIEGTEKLKVKLLPSTMTTVIENIDSIFKMPTGCFEQTSSSLYPDVVALRYMNENDIDNKALKEKATRYINDGYQRLLTFETSKKNGGFSLYGNDPAEPVLTAYGAMELKDVSTVYEVDENVINRMKEYLFGIQKSNGSFKISETNSYFSSNTVKNRDEFTLNAYIIWTLSETFPSDTRLEKSVKYIEDNLDKAKDEYTLALIANIFANTQNENAKKIVKKLVENVKTDGDKCYFASNIKDYWGSYGETQDIQTTALTSLALSKIGIEPKINKACVEYLISKKDSNGTWDSTQATILSLKAIVEYSGKEKIEDQELLVDLNGKDEKIKIEKNSLDLYEVVYDSLNKENHLKLNAEKGEIHYEVISNYYMTYDEFKKTAQTLNVESSITEEVNVNDIVVQKIRIENTSNEDIDNGMIRINIPQACSVREESLSKLQTLGYIQKYEYNYNKIDLYLRNFYDKENIELEVEYNANYPETVTGGMVRVYDYYNPEIEGYSNISVLSIK